MNRNQHRQALEAKHFHEAVDDEGIEELLARVYTDRLEQKEEQNEAFRSDENV